MKIKKTISVNGLIIKLSIVEDNGDQKTGNIKAFDENGKLFWVAEEPKFDLQYYDMQIDEEKNVLEADGGGGERYKIDLRDGTILNSELIK